MLFESVLQTAAVMGTAMVRVWAGDRNPDETPTSTKEHIVDDGRRIADLAAERQIRIVLEFHENSLAQTGQSCAALLRDLNHPNVGTYWQPAPGLDVTSNQAELSQVLPWLAGLHVFHWGPTHLDRHPLAEGESDWQQYLASIRECSGEMNVMLEFVKGESPEQFEEDAATLHRILDRGELNDEL